MPPAAPVSGLWLRYGSGAVLASPDQLRFAADDELLAAHTITNPALLRGLQHRGPARLRLCSNRCRALDAGGPSFEFHAFFFDIRASEYWAFVAQRCCAH